MMYSRGFMYVNDLYTNYKEGMLIVFVDNITIGYLVKIFEKEP